MSESLKRKREGDVTLNGGKDAKKRNDDDSLKRKIFVGRVPRLMGSKKLISIFSEYGEIEEGPTPPYTDPPSPGYAFFLFKTVEAAEAALANPRKMIENDYLLCRSAVPPDYSVRPIGFAIDNYRQFIRDDPTGSCLLYHFEDKFGKVTDLPDLQSKRMVLKASHAIVGLSSYTRDDVFLFASSGTIVEEIKGRYLILTSASLVRGSVGDDVGVPDVKINVHIHTGETLVGHLSRLDWHYNVAVVTFKKTTDLCILSPNPSEENPVEHVFSLGRHYSSSEFMTTYGNIISKSSDKFDCEELLYSSCKITKCGTGGALLNKKGEFIGLNHFDDDATPFLPAICLVRCLEHFKKYRKVCHPWAGLKLRTLDTVPDLEWVLDKFDDDFGLLVSEVEEGSPAHNAGIRKDDLITMIQGVPLFSVAQFAGQLLSVCEGPQKSVNDVYVKRSDKTEFTASLTTVQELVNRYRWPMPVWRLSMVLPNGMVLQ